MYISSDQSVLRKKVSDIIDVKMMFLIDMIFFWDIFSLMQNKKRITAKQMRQYRLALLVIVSAVIISAGCTMPLGISDSPEETSFRDKMLEEINLVRTSPSKYAETRLISQYNNGEDNGAYSELIGQTTLSSLTLNSELTSAADKYAMYLAENNVFGHYEDGTPSERSAREGYNNYSGENIAAGSFSYLNIGNDPETAAIEFVLMWIIDKGVAGVGHRKNILGASHKVVGIGYHFDSESHYGNYAVQDFGSF